MEGFILPAKTVIWLSNRIIRFNYQKDTLKKKEPVLLKNRFTRRWTQRYPSSTAVKASSYWVNSVYRRLSWRAKSTAVGANPQFMTSLHSQITHAHSIWPNWHTLGNIRPTYHRITPVLLSLSLRLIRTNSTHMFAEVD